MPQPKIFYRKKLPHIQPEEETFFITYRLVNSIPVTKLKELEELFIIRQKNVKTNKEKYNEHKRHFGLTDDYLDKSPNEPHWLKEDAIASIVAESLHFCNQKFYKLWCYCIMPNHVHLVITTLKNAPPLYTIMQKHKRHTATTCNKALKRSGQFWTHESYDHIIRNEEEFNRIVWYVINNPVKAGFVKIWQDWKWTFSSEEPGF